MALAISLCVPAPQIAGETAFSADSLDVLRDRARRSARAYELLLRTQTPRRWAGGWGGECDEIIGRFCFRYDDPGEGPDPAPPPEPEKVAAAREVAIVRHRGWLGADPSVPEAAGQLVRYLVEADRAREAVSVARAHEWAAGESMRSRLLVGLAHHYAGEFAAAEAVFDSARAMAPPDTLAALDAIEVLLDRDERGAYETLAPEERAAYRDRYWRLADPSVVTPGNERRSAHYARHAWIRILAAAPRVRHMIRWGRDHEEIVLRYGLPTHRERSLGRAWRAGEDDSMVEHFDGAARAFEPPALRTAGYAAPPDPGSKWSMAGDSARTVYTPLPPAGRPVPVGPVEHQATRGPAPRGAALRVDGVFRPDTAGRDPGHSPVLPTRGTLVLLDTLGHEVARAAGTVEPDGAGEAVRVVARVEAAPGPYIYSLELHDDSARLHGLARHAVALEFDPSLALSDVVVADPPDSAAAPAPRALDDPALRPRPSLVVGPAETLGLFATARGLLLRGNEARYAVEWWVESLESPSLLGRALGWLGRRIGLGGGPEDAVRVRWSDRADDGTVALWVVVGLPQLDPGLYRIGLRVTDQVRGQAAETGRLIRVAPTDER